MAEIVDAEPLAELDYAEVVDADSLAPPAALGVGEVRLLVAAKLGVPGSWIIWAFGSRTTGPSDPARRPVEPASSRGEHDAQAHDEVQDPSGTVTDANLNYVGSITLDTQLMELADVREWEQVHVLDIDNGARFETYVIPGGPGEVCLNGAAARWCTRATR